MPELTNLDEKKKFYRTNINAAERFHDEIAGYFHPETYVHYGQSQRYPTWYKVNIDVCDEPVVLYSERHGTVSNDKILNGKMVSSFGFASNVAEVRLSTNERVTAELSGRDDAGDGTVPASSMHLESNDQVKAVTVIDNIKHGASYNDELSRLSTLYSICKIVKSHGA